MEKGKRTRRRLMVMGVVALLCSCWPVQGFAENTVSLTILPGGSLNAGVVDGYLFPVNYADKAQVDFGVLHLIVNDPRGSSAGWSISIMSSDFVYESDSPSGEDISSRRLSIYAASLPRMIAGQSLVAGGPNFDPLIGASLDAFRTVIWAAPGAGSGQYEQFIAVALDIPAGSQAGIYIATLYVAMNSAP